MRNDGIRPALACLKIVILETASISASSLAVSARPIRSIRSAKDNGSPLELHGCIYLLKDWGKCPAICCWQAVQAFSPEGIRTVRFQRFRHLNAMRSQCDDEAKAALTFVHLSKVRMSQYARTTEHFPVSILYFPRWLFDTLSENSIDSIFQLEFVAVSK
jgi:hypothetical protein